MAAHDTVVAAVQALVGTSGYAYDFWRGEFYPEGTKTEAMLGYYAERLPTVEINNSFYRIPSRGVVQKWADAVPADFRFVIKASRRITHLGRLGDVKDSLDYMLAQLEPLGEKLGPILFQCPPTFRKSADRLKRFLSWVPEHIQPAMEFRHRSWRDDEIFDILRARNAALVINDDDSDDPAIDVTSDWGFLRLRLGEYPESAHKRWVANISKAWSRAYVFFKHEHRAAALALELIAEFDGRPITPD